MFEYHYYYNKVYRDWHKFDIGTTNYYCRSGIHLVCETASWEKDYKNWPHKLYNGIYFCLLWCQNQNKNKVSSLQMQNDDKGNHLYKNGEKQVFANGPYQRTVQWNWSSTFGSHIGFESKLTEY